MVLDGRAVVGVVVLATLLTAGTQPAAAGIYLNTVDDRAALAPSGHAVTVTGPIGCDAGEVVTVRVVVTQASTGAVGEGAVRARCTGDRETSSTQSWAVHVATRGSTHFDPGPATVEAWAHTADRGRATDRTSWRKSVELVERTRRVPE